VQDGLKVGGWFFWEWLWLPHRLTLLSFWDTTIIV